MQQGDARRRSTGASRLAGRRLLRSLRKDENGVTAIEFALIAAPFFTVVFAIIELGLAFFVNRMVDNAVIESARMVRTGQATAANFTADDFANEVCSQLPAFLCDDDRIRVSVTSVPDFSTIPSLSEMYDDEGNLNEDHSYTQSGASEIVAVNVIYTWPMFTSFMNLSSLDHGNERHLTSTMVFRNEPWE